jgi:hypothetical protein
LKAKSDPTNQLISHLFMMLAPTVGSQIVHHFGFDTLWYVVTGICVIAAVGFYCFGKHKIA